MAYTGQISGQQRALSGGGALIAVVAVGLGLASGLDLDIVRKASEADLGDRHARTAAASRTGRRPKRPQRKSQRQGLRGEQASQGRRNRSRLQRRLPPVVPQVAAAPRPGTGSDASAGATPTPGPGSGAGGRGDGMGAGGTGSGTGGGTKAAWRSGTIRDRDYPREASRAKAGGEVEVRFTIEASGRSADAG
jgi:protein TonB